MNNMDNTPGFCYTLFVLLRDVFSLVFSVIRKRSFLLFCHSPHERHKITTVRSIFVNPNVQGSRHMFSVKCRVHTSMKMFRIMYMGISIKEVETSFNLSVAAKLVKEVAASKWQLFCFPWSTVQTWVIL